ncbi:hypothetical protein [Aeromonas hydrophila]|uniref:hypothetical protein n=1 Tax=Aeromonas hydrophila TaxID=644 RepID=UPI001117463B|nr:hypothetical protein [Aeromonas hydrophila]
MYPTLNEKRGELFITQFKVVPIVGLQKFVSQSGIVRTRKTGTHRFEFEVRVQCYGEANIRYMQSFLSSNVGSPFFISPRPEIQATPITPSTVSFQAQAGATSISVSGHRGPFQYGDYIVFDNHPKIYNVTSELKSSTGTIEVYPPIRKNLPVGTSVLVQPPLLVTLVEENFDFAFDDVYWCASFTFKVSEV